jgi:hypothetical protein
MRPARYIKYRKIVYLKIDDIAFRALRKSVPQRGNPYPRYCRNIFLDCAMLLQYALHGIHIDSHDHTGYGSLHKVYPLIQLVTI